MTPNEKRFNKIYYECEKLVYAVIRQHNVKAHDRDDIAQQVWMNFWKALSENRLDFTKSVSGYIHQIAKNLCYGYFRSKSAHESSRTAYLSFRTVEDADLESFMQGEDSEANIDIVDQAKVLLAEVKTLPKSYAQVILLRLDGASFSEMSIITKKNLGTVKSRIFRGREAMKESSAIYKELKNFNDFRRVSV